MCDVRHDLPASTLQVLGLCHCCQLVSLSLKASSFSNHINSCPTKPGFALEIINKMPQNTVVYLQERSPFALRGAL